MATPKKKHLIELMIEAGVKWPDGAEYATQNNNISHKVCFYKTKPQRSSSSNEWSCYGYLQSSAIKLPSLCRNWHQTIVTREQYEQALSDVASAAEVQTEPEHCELVMNQNPYTINQLADDYYAKAAEAECLQYKADEARKLANEALVTLQKAGEVIGLVISVDTLQKCSEQHQQPVITDWCDLQIGDVIELTGSSNPCWEEHSGHEMTVTNVYPDQCDYDDQVILSGKHGGWAFGGNTTWCFIRRP